MLKERLQQITSVKEFDCITEQEQDTLDQVGRSLSEITSKFESSSGKKLFAWRNYCFDSLPEDVKPNVTVLALGESLPIRIMFDSHISMIRDNKSSLEVVRANLGAAYSQLMPYAFFRKISPRKIETPLGETISLAGPLDEKRTLFPILRAALPAAMSVGAALRGFGCKHEYVTARIARPDTNDYSSLTYFVDDQLFHIPVESVEDSHVYIIDPLIAAGGSIITAHKIIRPYKPKQVSILALCATGYGLTQIVRNLRNQGTEANIYTVDIGHLDQEGRVLPGYGDIGDRVHGAEERGKIRSLDELIGAYKPAELLSFQPEIDGIFKAARRDTPRELQVKPILATGETDDIYDAGPE
jgi:uracil phosphoribosyltransferase